MVAREELLQGDKVARTLRHLLAIHRDHIVVHPVLDHRFSLRSDRLCYLALVMRESQVQSTAMNVEVSAQVLTSHGGTLAVPPREALTPRRRPAHDVARLRLLPESEVQRIVLLVLPVQLARVGDHVLHIASAQDAVRVVSVVLEHVKVDAPLAHIGVARIKNLLY